MARRLLVIANETVASPRVVEEVLRRVDAGGEVRVVSPVLHRGRLDHFYASGDVQARAEAAERLDLTVAALETAGLTVSGEMGDASPLQALDDALRLFPADEVVVSTHPPGRSKWLEKRLVERARERHALPITHMAVDVEAGEAEVHPDPRHLGHRTDARVMVFHAAPYEEAIRIRHEGFRPVADHGLVGVSTVEPADDRGGVVFAVRVPAADLEGVAAQGGMLRVPADLLDRYGPPVESDAGHVE